ncbi:YybH family protein [Pedobacter sp. UYEF25]
MTHQILTVLHTQQTAWNNGDIERFMKGYLKSDSLLFIGSNGPTYGWQTTLDNYKKSYPDKAAMGKLTFDIKKVTVLAGDAAFVMGSWSLKRATDNPHGFFTLLFKKKDGQWKIAVDHTSSSKE